MRPEIVVRFLIGSVINFVVLYLLNHRRDNPEDALSIAVVATFIAAASVIIRSRSGKLSSPLTRPELVRLAVPATVLWLGVGLGDLIAQPHTLYVLVAGLAGLVFYWMADSAFRTARGKA